MNILISAGRQLCYFEKNAGLLAGILWRYCAAGTAGTHPVQVLIAKKMGQFGKNSLSVCPKYMNSKSFLKNPAVVCSQVTV